MFNFKDIAVVNPYYGFCNEQEVLEEFMLHGMIDFMDRPDIAIKMTKRLFANTTFGKMLSYLPFGFYGY